MRIKGKTGECEITVGGDIAKLEVKGKTVIITDSTVKRLHGDKFPDAEVIEITPGEENKTLETVERIYAKMLELEMDRSSLVLGIGGGIVCDIAGYVATTYYRGTDLGFVPTTLLAQVDAAIGGKNGVNYQGYKNLVGTIRQPRFVICDVSLLKTLSEDEIRNGYAEVVKQAAIGDRKAFEYLEENVDSLLKADDSVMKKIVNDSAAVKVKIVQADETEKEERMKLNYGHTIGHAIELDGGLRHGEAVSIGMVAEAKISVAKGLTKEEDAKRLEKLLSSIGLPVKLQGKKESVLDAIRKDKKRSGDVIRMPVLDGIGKAKIMDVKLEELEGQ